MTQCNRLAIGSLGVAAVMMLMITTDVDAMELVSPPSSPRLDAPPDALSLAPDLQKPVMSDGDPIPGRLVLQQLPAYAGTQVHHALWLPEDWAPNRRFPVIVEYLGNSGQVKQGLMGCGMGISGGRGFIVAVLPYVDTSRRTDAAWWWGDVAATVVYAKEAVPAICAAWGGDPTRVLLTGHSRGAIACNYIGLHDDQIARLWRAMVPFSHYDDAHIPWGMTADEQARAPERLARLGRTPQYIMGEHSVLPQPWNDKGLRASIADRKLGSFAEARDALGLKPITEIEGTRAFLARHAPAADIAMVDLPFVNHSTVHPQGLSRSLNPVSGKNGGRSLATSGLASTTMWPAGAGGRRPPRGRGESNSAAG
jgi:hypothetical protein